MKFSRRSKRFVIVRRSAAVVFALISMTLFFNLIVGLRSTQRLRLSLMTLKSTEKQVNN